VQETEKHVMNEKDLQLLKELRLMDDDFFSEAFGWKDRGSGVKRARFHSSMIDRTLLSKGEDFEDLVDTYVIFITEMIIWKGSLYHIERRIEEMDYAVVVKM